MPELSIIIPTKNRGSIFFRTLDSVIKSSAHLDAEIIVTNNSLIPVVIPSQPANVSVYDNPNNKDSVFSSRNFGASLARSQLIVFIDDDILVTRESFDYVMTFHSDRYREQHASACLNVNWMYPPELMNKLKKTVFGRYLIKHGFTAMKSLYGNIKGTGAWQDSAPFISHSLASFFFSIHRDDFIKIGGYDESHLHEGTDIDISERLNRNHIEIWINPLIMVYHNEEDRTEISNWLERKKRFGEVHGHSKNKEDAAYHLHYFFLKKIAFQVIYFLQPVLLKILGLFNSMKLDPIGFFIVDALLGANICKGYYSVREYEK